jgi:outer membrane protein
MVSTRPTPVLQRAAASSTSSSDKNSKETFKPFASFRVKGDVLTEKETIMKKVILMMIMFATTMSMHAQKFALVDMDYIFKNIPAYERANEQLNQVSKKWQAEVDAIQIEAQTLYKNYQNEVVFLSQEQKKARQDAIMEKEKEAADLKKKYFGPQGELFKKRTALMSPIQEEVYTAVKDIADLRGYQLVLDRASDAGIIFGSPKVDISNEVLSKLGYSN